MNLHQVLICGLLIVLANGKKQSNIFLQINTAPALSMKLFPDLTGKWKKTSYGEDANKNRVLDQGEIEKRPEPGVYDNLQFSNDNKCRVFGMNIELEGNYVIKTVNGKKKIYIYPKDTPGELSPEKKDQYALKFELVSITQTKLVLIPSIFEFMLIEYTKGTEN